jgi:hypothetical protein
LPRDTTATPSPPNPNYDFANALLLKVTDFREDGVKVKEIVNEFQRVYGGTSIRKIYGLSYEELPTYYHNGTSYVDGSMFMYSRYEIFTDVKTVLKNATTTVYHSNDLVQKSTTVTNFTYDSPNHRYLTKSSSIESDQTELVTTYKYLNDFSIAATGDAPSSAIKKLKLMHRTGELIEWTTSRIVAGTERYLSSGLVTY